MIFKKSLYLCFCFLCLTGCVRQQAEGPTAAAEMVWSSPIDLGAPEDTEPTIYVAVREHSGKVPQLEARMEQMLKARGYAITANPSHAGYILQLNVVYAGTMDPQLARQAVPGGYGHAVESRGQGSAVLITDVIIAARTLPKAPRKQSRALVSASVRSKVADEQVRVAAIMNGQGVVFAQARAALENAVIEAVATAFPAANAQ